MWVRNILNLSGVVARSSSQPYFHVHRHFTDFFQLVTTTTTTTTTTNQPSLGGLHSLIRDIIRQSK